MQHQIEQARKQPKEHPDFTVLLSIFVILTVVNLAWEYLFGWQLLRQSGFGVAWIFAFFYWKISKVYRDLLNLIAREDQQ